MVRCDIQRQQGGRKLWQTARGKDKETVGWGAVSGLTYYFHLPFPEPSVLPLLLADQGWSLSLSPSSSRSSSGGNTDTITVSWPQRQKRRTKTGGKLTLITKRIQKKSHISTSCWCSTNIITPEVNAVKNRVSVWIVSTYKRFPDSGAVKIFVYCNRGSLHL